MSKKISQLSSAADVTASDLFQMVDIEDSAMANSGTNKKVTAQLLANELAGIVSNNTMSGAKLVDGTTPSSKLVAITATGSTTARTIENRFSDVFNVKDFGAIGDGVADNQTAFQAAINAALAAGGGTIYIPKGIYNFPNTSNSAKLNPGLGNLTFKGDGYSSILKYWEGTGNDQQSTLFGNTQNNPAKGSLVFKDLQIQGSLETRSGRFGSSMFLDYYPDVLIDGCRFYNIAGMAMDFHYSKSFRCVNSNFENIAADAIRARDTFDFIVLGNRFTRIGDDAIANHTAAYSLLTFTPQRERIIIANNTIVNANQFVRCISAKKTIITGNTIHLAHGLDLRANFQSPPGTILEGGNPVYEIQISNNSFTDAFDGSIRTWINIESNVKSGTSTNNTIPGDYDSTASSFVYPWDYTQTSMLQPSNSLPRAFNLLVTNNTFSRTRSAVAAFSDYGYGTRLHQGITSNPAQTDADLTSNVAITLRGQFENFLISGNVIKDANNGIYIDSKLNNDSSERSSKLLKNGVISNNVIYNCKTAGVFVWGGLDGETQSAGISISCNSINCDPYRLNLNSNVNGTYDANDKPYGIWLQGIKAAEVINNTFSNCCQLILASPDNYISNNIAHCSTPIDSGFNIQNKGIGNIVASNNWIYILQDSDPTSATYLDFISITLETSSSIPTSGWYYRGWFVKNTSPSVDANNMAVLGWLRLTTGTGHVSGTDWAIARVSLVSPAT